MALLQNNYRDTMGVYKFFGASTINGSFPADLILGANRVGAKRNLTAGEGVTNQKAGYPDGYRNYSSWSFPQKTGALSTVNESDILVSALGSVAQGINLSADSSIIFTAFASGNAIASAVGNSEIIVTGSATAVAPLNAVGNSSIIFTANGELSAPSLITGTTSIIFTTDAEIRADGFMIAAPISTDLTVDQIVAGVWGALASAYNITGSMGEKLNDAGAAGNPWAALLADNITPDTFGAALQIIKAKTDAINFTIAGQVDANIQYVNDVEIKGTGSESDPWNPE